MRRLAADFGGLSESDLSSWIFGAFFVNGLISIALSQGRDDAMTATFGSVHRPCGFARFVVRRSRRGVSRRGLWITACDPSAKPFTETGQLKRLLLDTPIPLAHTDRLTCRNILRARQNGLSQ